ncbi:hypothetical protein FDENT_9667 [Fusarium denticulatum]|uniref:Uncharacterized protein n=1 Tax=Fusarium denticulatum TaxID=48507 RepID=A0A8H5TR56_9HYPO|nr:hypothetical protein FDENT_9667 [Fusarium denticulatum]
MSTFANPLDFLCYEYCTGCGDIHQYAGTFLRHKCSQSSERVKERKHILEKMVARELRRVRKTKYPATLRCVHISKRKRKPDAGDGPNLKVIRRNENDAQREHATVDNTGILTTSKSALPAENLNAPSIYTEAPEEGSYFASSIHGISTTSKNALLAENLNAPDNYTEAPEEGSYFASSIHNGSDGNKLEGSYFFNSTYASYGVNQFGGSYFANPLNFSGVLNSSELATREDHPEELMADGGDGMEFIVPKLH